MTEITFLNGFSAVISFAFCDLDTCLDYLRQPCKTGSFCPHSLCSFENSASMRGVYLTQFQAVYRLPFLLALKYISSLSNKTV